MGILGNTRQEGVKLDIYGVTETKTGKTYKGNTGQVKVNGEATHTP